MTGHSRSKNGVASLAYARPSPSRRATYPLKTWMPGTRPGMTKRPPHGSHAVQSHLDGRAAFDRLVDHAIALGELEQLIELLSALVGVDVEAQADLGEADRRVFRDAERAAEVEIALGRDGAGLERNRERGRDRFERHARAGDERLQQHVAEHSSSPEPPVAGCSPATA